jgi:hypothetical protein
MEEPKLATIRKLVVAGERAGFSVEEMIDLLQHGLTMASLLDLIEWRLSPRVVAPRSSRWIM